MYAITCAMWRTSIHVPPTQHVCTGLTVVTFAAKKMHKDAILAATPRILLTRTKSRQNTQSAAQYPLKIVVFAIRLHCGVRNVSCSCLVGFKRYANLHHVPMTMCRDVRPGSIISKSFFVSESDVPLMPMFYRQELENINVVRYHSTDTRKSFECAFLRLWFKPACTVS